MKQITSFLLCATLLLAACKNNKPKEITIPGSDGKEKISIDLNKIQDAAKDMEKQKAELEKLTPLSLEQLKALLPETLIGAPRKSYETNASMGAGLATAKYELNDSTDVKLNIWDCGGSGGAGIYGMQYMTLWNIQQDNDREYSKTIDFNGGKAMEHCYKENNNCTLTYFTGGRYLVTLEGNNVGADALKQAAGSLNIK
jgi:hypothetical protein